MTLDAVTRLIFVATLAGACNADSKAATPPAVATAPAVAKPVAPAPSGKPVLAAGESFLEGASARVHWTTAGERFDVMLVKRGDSVIVRVFASGDRVFDAFTTDAGDDYSLRLSGGGVVFETSSVVGRAPEVGVLAAWEAARIDWSMASNSPFVMQQWSCDDREDLCTKPAWLTGDSAATANSAVAKPAALTKQQARDTAAAWLAAALAEDAKVTGALMSDEVMLVTSAVGFYLDDGCSDFPTKLARDKAAACAIGILSAIDGKVAKKLRPTTRPPEEFPVSAQAHVFEAMLRDGDGATIVVERVGATPRVTAASIGVSAH